MFNPENPIGVRNSSMFFVLLIKAYLINKGAWKIDYKANPIGTIKKPSYWAFQK
jgi:hypothetical protein